MPLVPAPVSPDLIAAFHSDGFAVVRGLFSPEEIAEIRDTFMRQNENGPVPGLSDAVYKKLDATDPLAFYPRMMHPHRHPELPVGPLATRFMLDARLYSLLHAFMDEEPVAAQSMFYFKPAGARGQDLHQDNFYLRVAPATCCAAWLAIDDADEENGGMVLVPGTGEADVVCPGKSDPKVSFTDAHVPVPKGYEAQLVPLKAGDVLFFNGSVIHGSYPNTSQARFRRSLIFHYVPRHSAEMASFYSSLTFDGETVAIPDATGGGPCGTPFAEKVVH